MTPESLARATALLVRALGAPLRLEGPRLVRRGGRSAVWRCRVRGAGGLAPAPGAPPGVIVKCLAPESALGFTDLATLRFLGAVPGAAGLAPRVYGADVAARVVVLEDLGDTGTLDSRLNAGGAGAAAAVRRAGVAMAAQYARLHGETMGREAAFAAACRRIPGAAPEGRAAEAARWLEGLERARAWLAAAGCPEPPGLAATAARVAEVYAAPGPFLALTHGDPAPTNAHVGAAPEEVRLLDFEYAAYRHALYDLTAWDVLCPLPESLLGAMRRRYLSTLAQFAPAAGEAAAVGVAWGTMVTFRALAILSWIPPQTVVHDAPWVEAWTRRQAVLAALGRMERATSGIAALAPAAALARTLGWRLRARWPEYGAGDTAPRWPALFGVGAERGSAEGSG